MKGFTNYPDSQHLLHLRQQGTLLLSTRRAPRKANFQGRSSKGNAQYNDPGDDDDFEGEGTGSRRARSSDPWKTLVNKLDAQSDRAKEKQTKFGKKLVDTSENIPDELQCRHFDACSGCTLRGNFDDSPVIRQARSYFKSESVDFNVHVGEIHEWRSHVKLAVAPLSRWGGMKIGLYKAGSHEVEPITSCRVHHPRINEAVEVFKEIAVDVGVKAYTPPTITKEKKNAAAGGDLRYLQMSVERSTGKIQLVLVWNAAMYKDADQKILPRLVKKLKARPDIWHSISINFHTSASNVILNYDPKSWKLLWGPPTLKEKVGDANFFFRPQVFRQANIDLFEKDIIPLVTSNIPENARVAELYSGLGIIGLNCATKASEVLCSDSNEYVDEVFDKCADSLPEESQDRVYFENLPAEDAIDEGQCNEAQVLIVDPPRRGLDKAVLDMLTDQHDIVKADDLKRLIYISCGFDALESDSRALLAKGWKIKSADGYVMFPGSNHIETVAVFDR